MCNKYLKTLLSLKDPYTSLPALFLVLNTLLPVVSAIPDDTTFGIVAGEPIPIEPRTDPNTPKEKTIDMGNGVIMEFVPIPAGEFDMGSPLTERDRDNDEGPIHRVKISRPFYVRDYVGFRVVLEIE